MNLIFLKWGHWAHSPWQAFCILLICNLYLQSNDFLLSATKEFWVINELMAASTQGQNNSLKSEKFNHSTGLFCLQNNQTTSMIDFLFAELIAIFFGNFIELTNCLVQPECSRTPFVNVIKHFFLEKKNVFIADWGISILTFSPSLKIHACGDSTQGAYVGKLELFPTLVFLDKVVNLMF